MTADLGPAATPRPNPTPEDRMTPEKHHAEALRWLTIAEAAYPEIENRGSFPVRVAAALAQVHATLALYRPSAQEPAEPAQTAADGRSGPGEGERTPEPPDAHLGDPAGYAIVATRLHRGRRGELLDGDVVASAVSARPTLAEALDELRRVVGPAEKAEG